MFLKDVVARSAPGEPIGHEVLSAGEEDDSGRELLESKRPAIDLRRTRSSRPGVVVVIGIQGDGAAFDVPFEGFTSPHCAVHLAFASVPLALGVSEGFRGEGNSIDLRARVIMLSQHGADADVAGVAVNDVGLCRIGDGEVGSCDQIGFDAVEGILLGIVPYERYPVSEEARQRRADLTVTGYEVTKIAGRSKEATELGLRGGRRG